MNGNLESMCRTYILGRRVAMSIVYCIALQYIFLTIILIPVKMYVTQPETWARSIISLATYGAGYFFPLCSITIVEGLMSNKEIETDRKYLGTRFTKLCNIFSVHNIVMAFFHTLIGGLFFHLYISFIGGDFSKLYVTCKDLIGFNCLVESYVYLVSCGFWMGFYLYIQVYVLGSKNLIIPVVKLSKMHQIKSLLKSTFKQALHDTIFPTFLFALIYYFKGNSVKEKVCELFFLQFEDQPLASGFVCISVLLYSWFLSSIFLTTMNVVKFILQIHLTEQIAFPVVPAFGATKYVTLHEALSFKKSQAIQFLGYQDLRELAEKDQKRREELFSLSQPGGHPHNWNAIVEDCLKLINEFTADLNSAVVNSNAVSITGATKSVVEQTYSQAEDRVDRPTTGLRNLLMKRHVDQPPKSLQSRKESLVERFEKGSTLIREAVLKKPAVAFFFSEISEEKVRYVLSRGQLVVWAAESLALLAAASFHEDKYGVLQKDLPSIITALLQLKQILDKLQKSGNYKKTVRNECYDIRIKNALKSSVKRSLYRITVTFGNYLNELPLSKESLHQIHNFLLYKD